MLIGGLILAWFVVGFVVACFAGKFIAVGARECETHSSCEYEQRQSANLINVHVVQP